MRIVCRVFSDGTRQIYKTDNDGLNLEYLRDEKLSAESKARIVANIEAIYSEAHRDGVAGALHELEQLLPVQADTVQ